MEHFYSHFWTFLGAVWDHAFTLAAGCVVTVVINIVEKHFMNGKKLPLKADLAILLTFVFFACFQAWKDQFILAESRSKEVPGITVNVPPQPQPIFNLPPAQVIVETAGDHAGQPPSYIEVESFKVSDQGYIIADGREVAINVYLKLKGRPVNHTSSLFKLVPGIPEQEYSIVSKFRDEMRLNVREHPPTKDPVVTESSPIFGSGIYNPIKSGEADDILQGKKRLYLLYSVSWVGEDHSRGSIKQCLWLQRSTSADLSKSPIIFVPCKEQI
jgi:hypothetical protein